MTQGQLVAVGWCWCCKGRFQFDPDTVDSLPIDPVTQLPPDLGGDPGRAVAQPLCPGCVAIARRGKP